MPTELDELRDLFRRMEVPHQEEVRAWDGCDKTAIDVGGASLYFDPAGRFYAVDWDRSGLGCMMRGEKHQNGGSP